MARQAIANRTVSTKVASGISLFTAGNVATMTTDGSPDISGIAASEAREIGRVPAAYAPPIQCVFPHVDGAGHVIGRVIVGPDGAVSYNPVTARASFGFGMTATWVTK